MSSTSGTASRALALATNPDLPTPGRFGAMILSPCRLACPSMYDAW